MFQPSVLDHTICEDMAKYVEILTTSGKPNLDADIMKKFKKICKISDDYIKNAFHMVMIQLSKEHSEIRLAAFLVIDELFNRSHCFREELLSKFQLFFELSIAIDPNKPLPPPTHAAQDLKTKTLKAIQQWHDKYGEVYKKLRLGYNFLKSCKRIDFCDIRARSIAERKQEEAKERRKKAFLKKKLENVLKEIKDETPDIRSCLAEAENCLQLLLPHPDLFYVSDAEFRADDLVPLTTAGSISTQSKTTALATTPTTSISTVSTVGEDDKLLEKSTFGSEAGKTDEKPDGCITAESDLSASDDEDFKDVEEPDVIISDFCRSYGLGSVNYSIDIDVNPDQVPVRKNTDNQDIINNLKDRYCLICRKYYTMIQHWLTVLAKSGAEQNEIKKIIDLKNELEESKNKIDKINILPEIVTSTCEDEDSDDDFEEVKEKEGYESDVAPELLNEFSSRTRNGVSQKRSPKRTSGFWSLPEIGDAADPTTAAATLAKMKQNMVLGASSSSSSSVTNEVTAFEVKGSRGTRKEKLLLKAPVVSFGPDLVNWENPDKIEAPLVVKFDSLHRFWTPLENEANITSQDIAAVRNRTVPFVGTFEPVKWKCLAPLPNGKLCERMDRIKCPFHGQIISRNCMGQPVDPRDKARHLKETENKNKEASWRDPELEHDIEVTLGIDLGSQKSKGKKKGKGKGKGKNRCKYPHLTNIKKTQNTTHTRLEKKLLNSSAMKRISSALDVIDRKRGLDKFRNQFNYSYMT